MASKKIIKKFFNSDLANDLSLIEKFYHKDCEVHWNSSKGYRFRDFKGTLEFFKGITESYSNLRFDTTHLLKDKNAVVARYTLYGTTIESADEMPLAHYVSIIEFKDDKIYRVYEMSQPADQVTLNSNSF
ncbi:hypothetical protein C1T31_08610 [Hanstruepera neustonica]|uniref:SnoaL-like domain-containing protein n=1 Tax=Hanstruepera neustonica TaxID=1445657 RepID=A0A2K1DYD8_9FLAO|nr:nuclear transport factor 2 family protein [Hanstruepera neustonica]PNQ73045.1 hypothetical protein C1T31_08610 [Hanstruepera neustonica]